MDLQKFYPTPHPLKKIFEQHHVSQITLANYLNCSQSRVSQYLCGYSPIPEHIEVKLRKLANEIVCHEEDFHG